MRTSSLIPYLSALAQAAHITVTVPATQPLQNPSTLPASTVATLQTNGVLLNAPITRSSTFVFPNVSAGSYLLSVYSRDNIFETLRIDVGKEDEGPNAGKEKVEAWQTFRGNEWSNKGERRGGGSETAVVECRAVLGKDYYYVKSSFSVMSLFKNPMILIGVATMALVVGMPYLMENMDPEELEEMRKSSPLASRNNPAAQVQNFDLASWMAGATKPGTPTPAEEPRGGDSNNRGGNKRR